MKLYLSSYRFGNKPEILRKMVGGKKHIGVIRNALDYSSDTNFINDGKSREFNALKNLGLNPIEIDLRKYFNKSHLLKKEISLLDGLWVVGGNAFLLNYAFL